MMETVHKLNFVGCNLQLNGKQKKKGDMNQIILEAFRRNKDKDNSFIDNFSNSDREEIIGYLCINDLIYETINEIFEIWNELDNEGLEDLKDLIMKFKVNK